MMRTICHALSVSGWSTVGNSSDCAEAVLSNPVTTTSHSGGRAIIAPVASVSLTQTIASTSGRWSSSVMHAVMPSPMRSSP